jgi:hypothetical protein
LEAFLAAYLEVDRMVLQGKSLVQESGAIHSHRLDSVACSVAIQMMLILARMISVVAEKTIAVERNLAVGKAPLGVVVVIIKV